MSIDPRNILGSCIRRHGIVAAYAVLGIMVGALVVYLFLPAPAYSPEQIGDPYASSTTEYLAASLPVRLRIPTLDLDATFTDPLGLAHNGEIEVPKGYEEVGWYKYGPTPGELGPSVVLGHVDSVAGPAVFYSLGQLALGDEIEIEREDGSIAMFEVTALERYAQDDFPTQLVYGDIDHAGLRLVTCTGTFDRGIQRYSHNLVVYAAFRGE